MYPKSRGFNNDARSNSRFPRIVHPESGRWAAGEALAPKPRPQRAVIIDDVAYTYRDRTDPRFTMHDAECIAASLARDQRLTLRRPTSTFSASYPGPRITTVELNRAVASLMDGAYRRPY
jgi:hypothetical protein